MQNTLRPSPDTAHPNCRAEHSRTGAGVRHEGDTGWATRIHTLLYHRLPRDLQGEVDRLGLTYRAKELSWVWRTIGRALPRQLSDIWTTWRWPFCAPVIWAPASSLYASNLDVTEITRHELHHVRQIATWWGLLLAAALNLQPPLGPGGKWWVERRAYLLGVRSGWMTPEGAASLLSGRDYFWAWPKKRALAWFEKHKDLPPDGRLW